MDSFIYESLLRLRSKKVITINVVGNLDVDDCIEGQVVNYDDFLILDGRKGQRVWSICNYNLVRPLQGKD